VIAPEVSREQLKRLQREMIRAGQRAKYDPTPANRDRAWRAAVAYDRACAGWSE